MQRIFIFSILTILTAVSAKAGEGRVFDNLSMQSEILGSQRKYAVYLPPDYDISQRSYPVLYLLHGRGDDQTGWIQFGEVRRIADEAIRSGKATPMIIVMPDAMTGQRGYFNDISGSWRYEDFIFEELMPYVEKQYRVRREKRYRAIAGLSMGGGGTFVYALHHPELFAAACPLSASIDPSPERFIKTWNIDTTAYSRREIATYFRNYDPLSLVAAMDAGQLRSVRWYIDCGDDDFLYEGNSLMHIAMRKREIPHEYRVRDGSHNWTYWRTALPEVLGFVSEGFHQY